MQSVLNTVYHLVYTFGDIDSALALLSAINSPQVSRLSKSWDLLAPKSKSLYKHLSLIIPFAEAPINKHLEITCRALTTRGKGRVIPFLLPIINETSLVYEIYCSGYETSKDGDKVPVLTEVGVRNVESLISLVESCQGSEFAGWDAKCGDMRIPSDAVLKSLFDKVPATTGRTEGKLDHFLLTRVYYQSVDLWGKSVDIEGIGKREVVPEFLETEIMVWRKAEEIPVDDAKLNQEEELIESADNSGDELSYLDDLKEDSQPDPKSTSSVSKEGDEPGEITVDAIDEVDGWINSKRGRGVDQEVDQEGEENN
jgi:hypothetical protein